MNIAKEIDLKALLVMTAVCFSMGIIIDYFSELYWLTMSLLIMFGILINGLIIDIEDNQPEGWSYDENESKETKIERRKARVIHVCFSFLVLVGAIISIVYTK